MAKVPNLTDSTAEDLIVGLRNGHFDSVDLVNTCVATVQRYNPSLRAVMEINPDAWAIAKQLDEERMQGILRGPLHGLPILLKSNIGTKDHMQTNGTTCETLPEAKELTDPGGSYALQDSIISEDASVVSKLREKGLIILGKASLAEWSLFRSDNSNHAWNPILGQTFGAYTINQCPGGSSGGSAVSVDTGMTWAALATETSGSIISPCERNNVVGVKPTVGLTSRHMNIPVSEHQDTVGTIARTVKDAARLLYVIAGVDEKDHYTAAIPFKHGIPDYVKACRIDGLLDKRIGVARNVINAHQDAVAYCIDEFEEALLTITEAGCAVTDVDFTAYEDWLARGVNPVTRIDFQANIHHYFSKLEHNPHDIQTLGSLRAFTKSHPLEEYPKRNTANWDWAIDRHIDHDSAEFAMLYQQNLFFGGEGGIIGALERKNLDAIVLPSSIAFEIPALVGSPIVTVPLGAAGEDTPIDMERDSDVVETAPGLPFGISFLGAKWSEERLIGMAYAFEQLTKARSQVKKSSLFHQNIGFEGA